MPVEQFLAQSGAVPGPDRQRELLRDGGVGENGRQRWSVGGGNAHPDHLLCPLGGGMPSLLEQVQATPHVVQVALSCRGQPCAAGVADEQVSADRAFDRRYARAH